ncbi:hypothetical protein PAAG_11802 [Paracoccidioides lutzii Pb01]|uniref:Uncharacterized protein n=1 Tax=Paracoccidioides lutzii (strain ATCC MYA-826 / Pb01) TaxID=502779 RepID=A0A0A2VKN0_PARBA|nr:hypothetical protein PAAG_11802 [Paracoccidioides lutzii Pb01]KGQ01454.1 hypothetical protein PAAG_11802 [Paracoccidioides lutzii Pb01]
MLWARSMRDTWDAQPLKPSPVCLLGTNELVLACLVRLGVATILNPGLISMKSAVPRIAVKGYLQDTRVGPVATTGSSAAPRFNEPILTPCCGSQGSEVKQRETHKPFLKGRDSPDLQDPFLTNPQTIPITGAPTRCFWAPKWAAYPNCLCDILDGQQSKLLNPHPQKLTLVDYRPIRVLRDVRNQTINQ